MKDLNKAQAQLDEKQRELDAVQALYDQAMKEKQVWVKQQVVDQDFYILVPCDESMIEASDRIGLQYFGFDA